MLRKLQSIHSPASLADTRKTLAVLVGLALAGFPAHADTLTPEARDQLAAATAVEPAVVEALDRDGSVYADIFFTLPSEDDPRYAGHPTKGSDVHPFLFKLVEMAEPGSLELKQDGLVHILAGGWGTGALLSLSANADVIAIELAERPLREPAGAPPATQRAVCVPSFGQVCVSGGRFSIRVTHGGIVSTVRTWTGPSAAFSTYSSSNWEVLAKVLNGCSINGHYWILSAGATDVAYTLKVKDFDTGIERTYANASCPVIDTVAFDC